MTRMAFRIRAALMQRSILLGGLGILLVCGLMLYRLGTLTGGLSAGEMRAAQDAVGWHGVYNQPFFLPLLLLRSAVFALDPSHGQLLTRLPNVLIGMAAIGAVAYLVWLWHGLRTMILATALFATAAWTLHSSRLAGFDTVYLAIVPLLLAAQFKLKQGMSIWKWYVLLVAFGLLLYVPGAIWLLAVTLWTQRSTILRQCKQLRSIPQRIITLSLIAMWLPLLIIHLLRPGQFLVWLGLPAELPQLTVLLKQFAGVFMHLSVRGPAYPDMWLAQVSMLDVFTGACVLLGTYFYWSHRGSSRTKALALYALVGFVLVGLGGPVSLGLLVPIVYLLAATGLAYLLRDWLSRFPHNPVARGFGIGLVCLGVAVSVNYNLRSYFIAWPHNEITQATFRYHR